MGEIFEMKNGIIDYDFESERFSLNFEDGESYELHCGNTFQINVGTEWKSTRIEYDHSDRGWYLVGIKDDDWSVGSKIKV
jgi:hypothetical protein